MRRVIIALSVVAVGGLGAATVGWQQYQSFLKTPLDIDGSYIMTIKKGSNYRKVLANLVQDGVVQSDLMLKLYGRHSGKASKIRAGEYLVEEGATPVSLVDQMVSGKSIQYSFTIIEGSTYKELLKQLAADKVLKQTITDLDQAALQKALSIDKPSLEGLFLAETYNFERGETDLELLKRAHKLLNSKLNNAWAKRDKKLPYASSYEALTMASIVEKETARPDERPVISGVFVRRLNKGMRLQTDPTVIYGMGDSYKGNIRRADLRRPTPYNTYVIKGLPPTPIAMVGAEAINAALNPAAGKSLYFVAKGDGSHQFSNTLKEHNRAVRQYQLKRRKDYRSSP